MKEEWRAVVDYEGHYEVSNLGSVRSLDRVVLTCNGFQKKINGRILKLRKGKDPYYSVVLSKGTKPYTVRVHRLVALMFVGNLKNKRCVDHIDNNKLNNRANNLRWVSHAENNRYAIEDGIASTIRDSKLTPNDVIRIRKLYSKTHIPYGLTAAKYNMSASAIFDIVKLKTWKHIKETK